MTISLSAADQRAIDVATDRSRARAADYRLRAQAIGASAAGRDFSGREIEEIENLLAMAQQIDPDRPSPRGSVDYTLNGTSQFRPLAIGQQWRFSDTARDSGNWKSFGEFLCAVHRGVDARLVADSMTEGDGPGGGYSVPEQYLGPLLDAVVERGIANLCNRIPMSTRTLHTWGMSSASHTSNVYGYSVYWIGEGGEATHQEPVLRKCTLTAHKMMTLTKVSSELRDDAPDFERSLADAMVASLSWELDKCIVRGTGAGQPLGLLTSSALITVAKTGSQAADTFSFANAVDMFSRLLAPSHNSAVWLMNPTVKPQLYAMNIASGDTTSVPVFTPVGGANLAPHGSLLGLPIYYSEHCSTLGDLGDVVLFDPKAYLLGMRKDASVSTSVDRGFEYDEVWFRAICRVAGQPALDKAFTPSHGATQSTIITLAERGE